VSLQTIKPSIWQFSEVAEGNLKRSQGLGSHPRACPWKYHRTSILLQNEGRKDEGSRMTEQKTLNGEWSLAYHCVQLPIHHLTTASEDLESAGFHDGCSIDRPTFQPALTEE
jgi:hypothetical protein